MTRLPRFEWALWRCRPDISPPGISFYVDLNTEGLYLGGGVWRVEGYAYLTRRRSLSQDSTPAAVSQ